MVWHAGAGVIWLQGEPVDKGKVQLHLGTAGDKLDSGVRTERRTYTWSPKTMNRWVFISLFSAMAPTPNPRKSHVDFLAFVNAPTSYNSLHPLPSHMRYTCLWMTLVKLWALFRASSGSGRASIWRSSGFILWGRVNVLRFSCGCCELRDVSLHFKLWEMCCISSAASSRGNEAELQSACARKVNFLTLGTQFQI